MATPLLVQKFGGTSLGTAERLVSVAEIVKSTTENCSSVLVVSAMSSHLKSKGTTSRDVIISVGEKLSAKIVSALLRSHGINAVYVTLEKLVKADFDEKGLDQSFYDYLVDEIRALMATLPPGSVPVLTGYFGPCPGSILKTVGRGYTDLTAALTAVALKAQELQIWKEVDGIFTADPRKASKARLLSSISPDEAAELTYYGSEVIHPFTMEQVIRSSIPIRIKNTFNPAGHGTIILPKGFREEDHKVYGPVMFPSTPETSYSFAPLRGGSTKHPTAVTVKNKVTVLNVHSNRKSVSHGFFAHIFGTLDKYGIVVDLISTSEVHVSMALNPTISDEQLEDCVYDLRSCGTVSVIKDMAILSLVGSQMRHLVGIASKLFSVLASHGVNIEMISQGASEINISCVIAESLADVALCCVHDACILGAIDSDGH